MNADSNEGRRRPSAVLVAAGALSLGLAVLGCGPTGSSGAGPRPLSPPASGLPSGAADVLLGAPLGLLDAPEWPWRVPLPDLRGWHQRPERSSFLVLEHPASSSELVVRVWREDENVSRQDCERRARELRKLPAIEPGSELEHQPLDVPPGFDTVVRVGASAPASGEAITGTMLAFGGWARSCFAYAYTTRVAGPAAEQTVGDRLARMRDESLARLTLRSDTEPPPRPKPPAPLPLH
jgi:hypothetical protein